MARHLRRPHGRVPPVISASDAVGLALFAAVVATLVLCLVRRPMP